MMTLDRKIENVIKALAKHEDKSSIKVLSEIGTNSPVDEIRILTAKALVERNSDESLDFVISYVGKGINDLSTNVAMSTINELLSMPSRDKAVKILSEAEEKNEDKSVRETARSVKALIELS